MSDTTTNPFAEAEVWSVGGDFLPRGDHTAKVMDVEKGRSTNGYPQVMVQVGNEQGSIRDWIVVIQSTLGKVVQLTEALGLGRPQPGQFNEVNGEIILSDAYVNSWKGRDVGVRVGQRNNDPSKDEVKGYFSAVKQSDVPGASQGEFQVDGGQRKPQSAVDDDLPF
jgi:hypothetical protein